MTNLLPKRSQQGAKAKQYIKKKRSRSLLDWLDVLAISAWGVLLLKYWFTEKLGVLVHPRYFWLIVITGLVFVFIGAWKARRLLHKKHPTPRGKHLTVFAPGLSSGLLLLCALLGLIITPQPLSSQAASHQGLTDFLSSNRIQPQASQNSVSSEEKSLIDWARTIVANPNLDAYVGQKVKLQGFVLHPPKLPDNYLIITRFVMGHCALDAYPIGLPVQLTTNRQAYPPDTWLEIKGKFILSKESESEPLLAVQASSLKPIPKPKNPYEY